MHGVPLAASTQQTCCGSLRLRSCSRRVPNTCFEPCKAVGPVNTVVCTAQMQLSQPTLTLRRQFVFHKTTNESAVVVPNTHQHSANVGKQNLHC